MLPLLANSATPGSVDPALITALATLITALTALIKLMAVDRQTAANSATLEQVHAQTNGNLSELRAHIADLTRTQATPDELRAREQDPPPPPPPGAAA